MPRGPRCLRADELIPVFEGMKPDGSSGVLAADASDVCPENCIQLVPLESIQFTPEVLEENPGQLGRVARELDDVRPKSWE